MPLVAAAICPHPPLLVPELAAGAAVELDGLRAACGRAVAGLTGSGARHLVVIGSGPATAATSGPAGGSFAPWGVSVQVRAGAGDAGAGGAGAGDAVPVGVQTGAGGLPLSLLVGCWLVDRHAHPPVPTTFVAVGDESSPRCAALGARLQRSAVPLALLVMGDGTACRNPRAPGYHDPRAEPFDRAVAAALADVDTRAMLTLDPVLAHELLVAGRAPWQVLAGAVAADGRQWRGELHYAAAPYGVAYFVASWIPHHPHLARS